MPVLTVNLSAEMYENFRVASKGADRTMADQTRALIREFVGASVRVLTTTGEYKEQVKAQTEEQKLQTKARAKAQAEYDKELAQTIVELTDGYLTQRGDPDYLPMARRPPNTPSELRAQRVNFTAEKRAWFEGVLHDALAKLGTTEEALEAKIVAKRNAKTREAEERVAAKLKPSPSPSVNLLEEWDG